MGVALLLGTSLGAVGGCVCGIAQASAPHVHSTAHRMAGRTNNQVCEWYPQNASMRLCLAAPAMLHFRLLFLMIYQHVIRMGPKRTTQAILGMNQC